MSRHNEQPRIHFQISLRTLLVVTTLAGILAGFYGPSVYRSILTALGLQEHNRGVKTGWLTVSGNVTMNGKPLGDARVVFHSQNWGSTSSTDGSGAYSLSVPAGSYAVTVSKIEGPYTLVGGGPEPGDHPTEMGTETIPERYSGYRNGRASLLRFTVPANGRQHATFNLTSQDGDASFEVPVQ